MGEEINFGSSALAEYVMDGNEALEFKLVRKADDFSDPSLTFKPEMCHQIYGDNENVFGYRGLKVTPVPVFIVMSSIINSLL